MTLDIGEKQRTYKSFAPSVRKYVAEPPRNSTKYLDEAIRLAQEFLYAHQDEEGYWWGELESNTSMEAEYVMLMHIMGEYNAERMEKVGRHIEMMQNKEGGWPMYYGGAGDLSTSVECYTALKIIGYDPESEPMKRARRLILAKGGVEKTRIFTKIWLAIIGQWEWEGVPYLAPEIILLPKYFPLNIYSFASWTRATVVPMTIILSKRPTWPLPTEKNIDELYTNGRENADHSLKAPPGIGWEKIFHSADRILHRLEPLIRLNPTRNRIYKRVEEWILDHQEADGSWGGIQPPWVYSLIALKALGHSNESSPVRLGIDGFETFGIEDDNNKTWRLQACISPVWDTCLALNSLIETDVSPSDPVIVRAADWLIAHQIRTPGDWKEKVKGLEPGGWAFEFENSMYPDTDDVAEVLLALSRCHASDEAARKESLELGLKWVMGMQCSNGGWGSFDKDNTSYIATRLPFFDFGEVIDPPSVDVTAHILEAIGVLGKVEEYPNQVNRAVKYIWREQEDDGPWFGRWGINYIYGTASVLPGLKMVGTDMSNKRVQQATDWIETHQNEDGGWGELPASYANPMLRGIGESSASQTGWALIALIAAGRADSKAAQRGVAYLLETQAKDGSWSELQYTAAGFPGYMTGDRVFKKPYIEKEEILPEELPASFMIKYHMYRVYWPLLALGRYRKAMRKSKHSEELRGE